VDGTTGYDFLGCALALMHDREWARHAPHGAPAFVGAPPEDRSELQRFVAEELLGPELRAARGDPARLRQLVVAIGAKAFEDTLLYRDGALLSLCELGVGDPDAELEPREATLSRLRARGPRTLNATQTHDTKRGEDVRARLVGADAGRRALRGGARAVARDQRGPALPLRPALRVADLPDAARRVADRAGPAVPVTSSRPRARPSRRRAGTSRTSPTRRSCVASRGRCSRTGRSSTSSSRSRPTSRSAGAVLSLAQLGLKLTTPGVVDIYQGCELWDLSLVDPDNRRPVDFDLRRRMLAELDTIDFKKLPPLDPRHKLKLLRDGLRLR
jgi:(1->4)-alpha-D-glucan 1-alpha-D-glucosylmutase